jgi:hypothetical protein
MAPLVLLVSTTTAIVSRVLPLLPAPVGAITRATLLRARWLVPAKLVPAALRQDR